MIFWPLYLLATAYALFKHRSRGSAVLFSGAAFGLTHHLVYLLDLEMVAAYWAFFMISFGWFFVLGGLRNIAAEVAVGLMSLFLLVVAFDSMYNPYTAAAILYTYPVIICICNLIVLIAGLNDRGRMDFAHSWLGRSLRHLLPSIHHSEGGHK